jgi:imidazolonepropionase
MWDSIWLNAHLATMRAGAGYGEVRDGAIAIEGDRIAWVGERAALPAPAERIAREVHDARGAWITPALIDCHTHVVFGGDRVDAAAKRLSQWLREGATVVEIKSGYGLELDTELRMLRAARRLGERLPLTVRTTFLGAHALPPEYEGRADDYIRLVCEGMLPAAAREGLVDAVDAFCERIGFMPAQTARVFEAARALGLPVKLHADQLSDLGGAALAARFGALSADHLEYSAESGLGAMGRSGTVAVLLPGAFYFLREKQLPPVEALRRNSVPIALATDCNPGSSPLSSLLAAMNMACTLFRLTPLEALAGATRNAARALGIAADAGSLECGKAADFALWDIARPADLAYAIGANPCRTVVHAGVARAARAIPSGQTSMSSSER